ncbi:MAG: thioesterase family protein [Solirubrobacterales bacterium]|nr:thioesterase family protein [Solirubrobacterales bacterium]
MSEEAVALPSIGAGDPGDGLVEELELTGLARGPWQEDAAHGGAPAALIVRSAEAHSDGGALRVASLNMSFYGPVLLGPVRIESETVKPGRRQRVVAVRLISDGRVVIDARAILIRRGRVDLPEGAAPAAERLPGPETAREVDRSLWADGEGDAFHRNTNTVLALEGGPDRVGPTGSGWFRLDFPLVPGEIPSGAQRAAAAADFGNGLAHPVAFGEFLFVNCDLNLSLLREPDGEWIGLDSRTDVDPGGSGLTTTTLYDGTGRCGSASQILYVDRA